MKRIGLADIEFIAFRLARETLAFNEPIPEFSTRFPNSLESCLAAPFQTFGGKSLYRGLMAKVSMLFYLMIKNHPFQNGNKRIAMTTMFVFLYMNKKWLKVDNQELYNFAIWVASSNPKLKTETVMAVEKFIKTYMIDMKDH
jgi:death-on-curing protein